MKAGNKPTFQPTHIPFHIIVNLWAPFGNVFLVFLESLKSSAAHISDAIHRFLEAQALCFHENNNHVIRFAARLLLVEGEEVLNEPLVARRTVVVHLDTHI